MKNGSTDEVIAENVKELMSAGQTYADAVMLSYKHAGRSRGECMLAHSAAEQQDPAHAVPVAQNGFRGAAERPVGRIAR